MSLRWHPQPELAEQEPTMTCEEFLALPHQFDDFTLTDAIRLNPDDAIAKKFVPREGYAVNPDIEGCIADKEIHLVYIAVTKERLLELFYALIDFRGTDEYDVVLESTHDSEDDEQSELLREDIEGATFFSYMRDPDYEDVLLNDGSMGISVMNADGDFKQVQLNQNKMIVVYTSDLPPFESFLHRQGLRPIEYREMINEISHIHHSSADHYKTFVKLASEIGAEEEYAEYTD